MNVVRTAVAQFYHSFTGRMMLAALVVHLVLAMAVGSGVHRIVSSDLKDEFVTDARNQARQFVFAVSIQPMAMRISLKATAPKK